MDNISIRAAVPDDAGELLKIYSDYVAGTAVSFEYEAPDVSGFRCRIERTLPNYPYLAAERHGTLLGYAYTGPFGERAAYAWSAKTSIYVRQNMRRQGIGRALYNAIEAVSRLQGITNLYACISVPETDDDPFLSRDSVFFHDSLGYRPVGKFQCCGYKFNRWYHVVWMEKHIACHPEHLQPPRPFSEIPASSLASVLGNAHLV